MCRRLARTCVEPARKAAGVSAQPDVVSRPFEEEFYQVGHSLAPGLRAVAILNGCHDPIGKDGKFSSNGAHTLLELCHVWGIGQHVREVVVSCGLLPLLIEEICRANGGTGGEPL